MTSKSSRLALALAFAACASACRAPLVRPATFRVRPDSVAAGDLRGPFDGRVVDSETGRPVAGALVYATWSFVTGTGLVAPAGWREVVASTDSNGRYRIARLDSIPRDGSTRVSDFRLVVYKRGYVAYRSDRRFADLGPRTDFTQLGHEVELERWRSDFSHVKHLRYVGGGATLAELTAWEIPEAARELARQGTAEPREPRPGEPIGLPPLQAEKLLHPEDVAKATGFDGAFDVRDLGDEPTTSRYDSVHLQARDREEGYDVALRVWHLPPDEAEAHYDRMKAELPGVEEKDELADRSLRAATPGGEILGFAFLDAKRGVVALLQCGSSQCKSHDAVLALARIVKQRVEVEFQEVRR